MTMGESPDDDDDNDSDVDTRTPFSWLMSSSIETLID
jgi:hypothetical protein